MPTVDLPEFLTVAEVAKILRVCDMTVHRMCREKRLRSVRVSKRLIRIETQSLVDHLYPNGRV